MNTITINGRSFSVKGNNISVINNKVIVDGVTLEDGLSGIIEVKFEGGLASLNTDSSATIHGNVHGNVYAGGSVECEDVGKNVNAGGSVNCGNVIGDVNAGGSVRYKR